MIESARALGDMLATAHRVVAFTGAGISTESGIPDFRGPQGLWTKMDPSEFTLQNYLRSTEHRQKVWRMRVERADVRYEPNDGHRALADLERAGILDCVITQNVDGLHQDAGSTTVFELHGSPRVVRCLSCARSFDQFEILARVRAGEADPSCAHCGGILKSGTISFGEALPPDVFDEAGYRARQAEVLLVVGSSLVVHPAAGIPLEAVRSGARLVILNAEPTPFDDIAALVIAAPAGACLATAAGHALAARAHP